MMSDGICLRCIRFSEIYRTNADLVACNSWTLTISQTRRGRDGEHHPQPQNIING